MCVCFLEYLSLIVHPSILPILAIPPPPLPSNNQPIVHKFDHAYVASVLKAYPDKFKGVCLANPTLGPEGAAAELANLHSQGAPVCFDM